MNDPTIFFDGFAALWRIIVSAPLVYVIIIASVRISGKRSTSQMNNFDWVVTVALGSISASCVMLDTVTVVEAVFATGLLLSLQWGLTYAVVRSPWIANLVKSEPRLLVHEGEYLEDAMCDERITKSEIRSALRSNGLTDISQAQWVILETDATFAVIPRGDRNFDGVVLEGVAGFPKAGSQ